MSLPLLSATVPDWIGAISTAVLGVAGGLFGGWQWWMSGFRPRFEAQLDVAKQAIRIQVDNAGRGPATITEVAVVRGDVELPGVIFDGFPDGPFTPTSLPGSTSMTLIVKAPPGTTFHLDDRIQAVWGGDEEWLPLTPIDVGLSQLRSQIPRAGTDP